MFRVRWAANTRKEDEYFTAMCMPKANKSKTKNPTTQNEPSVLARHMEQCFFITNPSRPSCVVIRSGKRALVGMDGDEGMPNRPSIFAYMVFWPRRDNHRRNHKAHEDIGLARPRDITWRTR
jgi:hypothetical protein